MKKVIKSLLALVLGFASLGFTPVSAEETGMTFVPSEGTGISMTEERSFTATYEFEVTKEELEAKITEGDFEWYLSREKGYQDAAKWPHQYLGGKLTDWKVEVTAANKGEALFENIKMVATDADADGKGELVLTFDNQLLFGFNGTDNRERYFVRSLIMDYTGPYNLTLKDGETTVATKEVQVRPYDSYLTSDETDAKLVDLMADAIAKGIYAKVEQIGTTGALGRPINALFIAKDANVLTNWQKLAERMETEPEKVIDEIKAGTLKDYQVPVLYSNVHADEIIGTDGVMMFLDLLVSNADGAIVYNDIDSLTELGKETVKKEMAEDGVVWSELIKDKVTGVGYIQGEGKYEPTDPKQESETTKGFNEAATVDMTEEEMATYYNITKEELNVKEVLNDVFFIAVPQENADGRYHNVRTNALGFDLNRDNTYQTQNETQAMTHLIAKWNPVSFHEIHGYYTQYQVEPCSPVHEPNVEYDIFMDLALAQGEAFGAASIVNNDTINSFNTPMRDYLFIDEDGNKNWVPFDDMSTSYTPQYALTHGAYAYTVELPYASADAAKATAYGFVGNAAFVAENKEAFLLNQATVYYRGVNNIDAEEIRPWYVSQSDEIGKEADMFRPVYEENKNFFPEYYVIPVDVENQQDIQAVNDMVEWLLRNDVRVKRLTADTTVNGVTYKAGTVIVDMHQAKRNVANAALYDNLVIDTWTDLYSEPVTNFSALRGFDMDIITKVGAFKDAKMENVTEGINLTTVITGKGKASVIANNSVHAVKAVNELLADGVTVGYVTEGEHKGDFVVATKDLGTIAKDYILVINQTDKVPTAKVITKTPTIYVPGRKATYQTKDGREMGVKNYLVMLDTTYAWDIFAYGTQLGFELTYDATKADIIVGAKGLSASEVELVKGGLPYVGYTYNAMYAAEKLGLDIEYTDNGWHDALTEVVYPTASMVTDKYAAEEDTIMYQYGSDHFSKLPAEAKVLIKTAKAPTISGFISCLEPDWEENYQDKAIAFEYIANGLDMTVFAGTMTNKAHQQDDYRYVTNAIYQRFLGDAFKIVEPVGDSPATGDNYHVMAYATLMVLAIAGAYVLKSKKSELN